MSSNIVYKMVMRKKIILVSVVLILIFAVALGLRRFILGDILTKTSSKADIAVEAKAYLATYKNRSLYPPSLEGLDSKQIVSKVSDLKDTDSRGNDIEAFGRFRKSLIGYIAKLEGVELGSFGPDVSPKIKEKTLSSIDEGVYADQANTILENPGFESLSPDGYLIGWQKDVNGVLKPVNTVDTKIYRSGARSLKLSPGNNAETEFIKVDKSKLYHFSVWAKTDGSETQFKIYSKFYDANKKPINSNGTYRDCSEQTSVNGNWQRYVDTAWAVPTDAVYLTFVINTNTNCSKTDIYFDDASIIDAKEGIDEIGCQKSGNSYCLDLGKTDLGAAKITADDGKKVDNTISTDDESGIRYRTIPWYGYNFQIPAFNVDDNGNPKSPMLLEVRYKDNYDSYAPSGITTSRWYLGKTNDLFDPSENLVWDKLKKSLQSYTPLGGRGDGQWKTSQALIDISPYPGLKAKDGFFNLKIFKQGENLKSVTTGKIEIPVSYISIKSISVADSEVFKKRERELFGYNKIIFKPTVDNQGNDYSGKQLAFFSYDTTRLIYPYTVPSKDEVNKPLEIVSFPGESESVNGGVYSLSPADVDISVEKADEKSGIDSSDIKIYQVVYNHREKNSIVPDYLSDYHGPLKVGSADAPTQGVWLKIKVPQTVSAGDYKFNLKINSSSQNLVIPLTIKIIGIKLEDAPYQLIAYSADPFVNGGTVDAKQHLEFLREYDLTPMTYFKSDDLVQFQNNDMIINKDSLAEFDSRIKRFSQAGVLKKYTFVSFNSVRDMFLKIYNNQYKSKDDFGTMSKDSDIYNKITNPDFQKKYRQVLTEFDKIGDKYNTTFYFSYGDEISGKSSQVIWQALHKIHEGQKTRIWETVNKTDVCEEKIGSDTSNNSLAYSVPDDKVKPLSDTVDSLVWSLTTSLSLRSPCQGATNAYYTTNISRIKDPVYHRYIGSIFAYANQVSIFALYTMGPQGNPYDEFDKQLGLSDFWRYRDSAIAYPTSFGRTYATPVTEAIHEGYKDAKLIATLEKLIKECESSSSGSSGLCGQSTTTALPSVSSTPTPPLSPTPSASYTTTPSPKKMVCGDANRDGKVNILDINVVVSNWKKVMSKFNLVDGSKDKKGTINALDLSNITSHWKCSSDKQDCICDDPST